MTRKKIPTSKRPASGKVSRKIHIRVMSAKKRKKSSTRWLERHFNDPYVIGARNAGYRSRSAFKLEELDDRLKFLKAGMRVIELGSAPGGWTQVLIKRLGRKSKIISIDLVDMDPIPGANILKLDFSNPENLHYIKEILSGPADAVLSDMSPPTTGHSATDHIRIMNLTQNAFNLTRQVLAPNGCFLSKVFKGGTEKNLLTELKGSFKNVKHTKPLSSRPESAETYVFASGYKRSKVNQ